MLSPEVQSLRNAQFDDAQTAGDVARLQKAWEQEDLDLREREKQQPAENANAAQLAKHARRLAALEQHNVSPELLAKLLRYSADMAELDTFTSLVKRIDPARGVELADIAEKARNSKSLRVPLETRTQFADAAIKSIADAIQIGINEALMARPSVTFTGAWDEERTYNLGDLTYYGGSCWHANGVTTERPTTSSTSWKLFSRSGRDGRHGKDAKT